MAAWPIETIEAMTETDDLHIAPYRADGKSTGTLTWIWSVVVDCRRGPARAESAPPPVPAGRPRTG